MNIFDELILIDWCRTTGGDPQHMLVVDGGRVAVAESTKRKMNLNKGQLQSRYVFWYSDYDNGDDSGDERKMNLDKGQLQSRYVFC